MNASRTEQQEVRWKAVEARAMAEFERMIVGELCHVLLVGAGFERVNGPPGVRTTIDRIEDGVAYCTTTVECQSVPLFTMKVGVE
jgi:hypothetical protein